MTEWRCPECDTANDGTTSRCVVCDGAAPAHSAGLQPAMGVPARPVPRRSPPADLLSWRVAGVALVVLAGLLGGGYLLIDAGARSATGRSTQSTTGVRSVIGAGTESAAGTARRTPPSDTPTLPERVGLVSIADDVAADPRAVSVAALFDTYFTGVNAHDASVATRVFAPGGVVDPADPGQVATFGADIATTRDSDVWLLAVTDDPQAGEVLATVSFTSTQDPGYGPPERRSETCTDWRLDFRLTSWEGNLLIFGTSPGAVSAPCA